MFVIPASMKRTSRTFTEPAHHARRVARPPEPNGTGMIQPMVRAARRAAAETIRAISKKDLDPPRGAKASRPVMLAQAGTFADPNKIMMI
jgi:hypothetical protein